MKYMGSKSKIAKDILPIILKSINNKDCYVEPFCGGLNIMDKVIIDKPIIANDFNPFLIAMWIGLQNDFDKPMEISKILYDSKRKDFNILKGIDIKLIQNIVNSDITKMDINNKIELVPYIKYSFYDIFLIGWVGFMASFNGRFFDGGYSGKTNKRDYIDEQIRNTIKQLSFIKNIKFVSGDYSDFSVLNNCIIYCDIPYQNTKKYSYSTNFNYDKFWEWCRIMSNNGNEIYISEYNAPEDFTCVWQKEVTNSLNPIKTYKPIEKLFTIT